MFTTILVKLRHLYGHFFVHYPESVASVSALDTYQSRAFMVLFLSCARHCVSSHSLGWQHPRQPAVGSAELGSPCSAVPCSFQNVLMCGLQGLGLLPASLALLCPLSLPLGMMIPGLWAAGTLNRDLWAEGMPAVDRMAMIESG